MSGTRKLGVADPLGDAVGRHQLLRMMKSPHVITEIVDDGGKVVEVIDRVAVLKRGSASENWGWEHIVGEDHHNQIKKKFGLRDNDKAVKDFISEGLEKGAKVGDSIIWDVPDSEYKLKIVLSDKPISIGSITSAYPDRGV